MKIIAIFVLFLGLGVTALFADNIEEAEFYINRGFYEIAREDYTGALQDCNKAIELDPKDAKAYYCRGFAKELLKDKFGALADYSKAGELGETKAYEEIQRIQKGN